MIIKTRMEHGEYNPIVLDWSKLVAGNNLNSVNNLTVLGEWIAEKILVDCPHIAAGRGLIGNLAIHSLNSNDAHSVDVIHTDANISGYGATQGHIDLWSNEGTK